MDLETANKVTGRKGIPSEWSIKHLGDLASFKTGPFGSALHKSDYVLDGTPLINPMHIVNGGIVPSREMTVNRKTARRLSDYSLQEGDVIIGRRGEMGRCAVVGNREEGWLCGTGSLIIRPNDYSVAGFLQRILASTEMVKAIENASVGSTMVNLNQGILESLEVRTPPLPEQRAIAEVLSDVDALIEQLDALIAKKRAVKTATMQRLITGKQRLPVFDGAWESRRLGDLLTEPATYGIVKAGDFGRTGIPMIRGGDIKEGSIGKNLPLVSPEKSNEYSRTILSEGDIVIALVGYPGESAVVPRHLEGANVSRAVGVLRLGSSMDGEFLVQFLNSPSGRSTFLKPGVGSAQTVVNLRDINNLRLSVPCLREQKAIATILSDMDAEIEALEARREKTQRLKQGMMQELLTGRTRLV